MVGRLVSLVDFRQIVAEIYDHSIAVHPVLHIRELLHYIILNLVYSHDTMNIKDISLQIYKNPRVLNKKSDRY